MTGEVALLVTWLAKTKVWLLVRILGRKTGEKDLGYSPGHWRRTTSYLLVGAYFSDTIKRF